VLETLAAWLQSTRLGWAIGGGYPWIWPVLETLHFIGMSLLFGIVAVLDLRMLGVAKGLPLGPLQRLLPWAIAGFIINLVTGLLFFAGNPTQYTQNIAFFFKMLFIVLAGINVILFYVTGLSRTVDGVGAGQDVPPAAKLAAAFSLVLWLGVMYWGRMLPFIGNAF
jgi:hypothetical protein